MQRALVSGLLLAALVIVLALASNLLAVHIVWPALLAGGLVLAPGRVGAGRVAAFLIGGAAGWIGFAVRAAVLPDLAVSPGIALALAVAVVTVLGAATFGRLPVWSGVVGVAAFSGVYEAAFVAAPTLFLSESVIALTTFLAAGAIGALAGLAGASLMAAERAGDELTPVETTEGGAL